IVEWSMRSVVSLPTPLPWCRLAADLSNNFLRAREETLPLLRSLPQLPQPLAGAEQDDVEALRLDLQVLADLLFALVRQVEPEEDLAVAVEAQLVEKPLHLARLLGRHRAIERRWTAVHERDGRPPLLLALRRIERPVARLLAPVGDEEIARRA